MKSILNTVALSALSLTHHITYAVAEIVTNCPKDGVCYSIGLPEASASSGSGNIYFQLSASTSYTWVALGTGISMMGAHIFVMYADGNGNVTVSARRGEGHRMPEHDATTDLEVLQGSGVQGDTMIANVRCGNCETYGTLSLDSDTSDWIASWKSGASLDSTNPAAEIEQHDAHDGWQLQLANARLPEDANPFLGRNSGNTDDTPNGGGDDNSGVVPGSGQSSVPAYIQEIPTLAQAHGIIMSIVMIALYPIGSILMPLLGIWWVHALWQGVAFLLMWAGFALGVIVAQRTGLDFTVTHTQFGTAIVALFGIQPFLGYLHHWYFVRHGSRGAVSHVHIWYGRILMLLGIVNGGLGLALAGVENRFVIAYSVVAGVIGLVYIGSAILGAMKRNSRSVDGTHRKVSS